jgi:hypothetical protein
MSIPFDPYKAPQASLDAPAPATTSAEVPASVVLLLDQTRPWVKLVSVLFFIALGLMVLGLIIVVTVMGASGKLGPTGMSAFIPFAIMMLLYVLPTVYLWQYAGHIRRLKAGGGWPALQDALASQKSFWKYIGILAIVVMGLYLLAIVGGGMFGALRSGRGLD